jgi:hypothetical protein
MSNPDADAVVARRRALANALRGGEDVVVTPSGEVEFKDEAEAQGHTAIQVPDGKLASGFYWYQNDPDLLEGEKMAMAKFFPTFKLHQLDDGSGRIYWRGKVQPTGKGGMVWDLMLIYKNTHPSAGKDEFGGSIQILPVKPRLKDIASSLPTNNEKGLGLGLPHIYRGMFGRNEEYFICTADPKHFKTGQTRSTSAASSLSWACKWIILCEMWLNGEVSDEVAMEGVY